MKALWKCWDGIMGMQREHTYPQVLTYAPLLLVSGLSWDRLTELEEHLVLIFRILLPKICLPSVSNISFSNTSVKCWIQWNWQQSCSHSKYRTCSVLILRRTYFYDVNCSCMSIEKHACVRVLKRARSGTFENGAFFTLLKLFLWLLFATWSKLVWMRCLLL